MGLSGTLGDQIDYDCLEKIYNAQIFEIPPHNESKFEEYPS